MKILFNIVFICFTGICVSQTSAHVDVIQPNKVQKSFLLIDYQKPASPFNTTQYSQELKQQITNTSILPINTERMSRGWLVFSRDGFKGQAYQNFVLNYQRSELERLLPQPPDLWNFCPSATN